MEISLSAGNRRGRESTQLLETTAGSLSTSKHPRKILPYSVDTFSVPLRRCFQLVGWSSIWRARVHRRAAASRGNILTFIYDNCPKYFPVNRTAAEMLSTHRN